MNCADSRLTAGGAENLDRVEGVRAAQRWRECTSVVENGHSLVAGLAKVDEVDEVGSGARRCTYAYEHLSGVTNALTV